VHAHRLSASDAYVFEVRAAQARRVRLGYGSGDELVEGTWREAWTLSAEDRKRGGRRAMLAPQEQVAHILSGSRPPNPSEDLLLRARLDLDQGRSRQAALQARAAHSALAAELQGEAGAEQVAEQVQGRTALAERLAAGALEGPLTVEQDAELQELVAELERIARRRRHA
jgi:hypothetical protein